MSAAESVLRDRGHSSASLLRPWIVCFTAALFFLYEFVQMEMFNVISTDLMHAFSLNATKLGILSSTYLWADVAFLLPAGLILDRFSTRNVILIAMSICIIGTVGFALSTSVWAAGCFHFLAGIGNGFCFLSCIILAARWFPPRRQALVIGLILTIAFLGGYISQTPLAIITKAYGWRDALYLDGVVGLFILGLIWMLIEDYPAEKAEAHAQQREAVKGMSFWDSIKRSAKILQMWLCGAYASLLNLPIMVLSALWGSLYLSQAHHMTMTQATNITSAIFFGSMFGCPIAGYISDKMGKRRLPMLIGGIASFAIIAAVMYLPGLSYVELFTLFFLLGFVTSTQIISYPAIAENSPPEITGTATALASCVIMGLPILIQPLFGYLIGMNWDGTIISGVKMYSQANLQLGMIIFPIAFIIAIAANLLIKETYCRPQQQQKD